MVASPIRVSEHPRVLTAAGFLDEATRRHVLERFTAHEEDGTAELPLHDDPIVSALAERLDAAIGVRSAVRHALRVHRYRRGEGYPGRVDAWSIDDHELVATAVVCLAAPESGGETVFLGAADGPLALRPEPGRLVAWHNGVADERSRHHLAPVLDGELIELSWFVYGPPQALVHATTGERASAHERALARRPPAGGAGRGFGRLLAIVDDGVPEETVALLRTAADRAGVTSCRVETRRFDFAPERRLRHGDLLYRPAVSMHSLRVEQHLWHAGVATFHRDPDGPLFSNVNAAVTFSRAGLAVPRTFWVAHADRDLLRSQVDALGGLPVVIKALGYSSGVGVIRADSLAGLFSVVDYMLAEGTQPLLTSYVPEAVHWRLVVVGDRVVASYRNVTDTDDFRTSGSEDLDDYEATPPEGAEDVAVRACHALRVDHGGVDVLEHPSGRLYVLEANFPCYYAQAQLSAGVDVAGAMLEHLLARAEDLAPAGSEPWPAL